MNKIYTDETEKIEEVIQDPPNPPQPKPEKQGINKILLGVIVLVLIAVVTYFIIQYNRKNNA